MGRGRRGRHRRRHGEWVRGDRRTCERASQKSPWPSQVPSVLPGEVRRPTACAAAGLRPGPVVAPTVARRSARGPAARRIPPPRRSPGSCCGTPRARTARSHWISAGMRGQDVSLDRLRVDRQLERLGVERSFASPARRGQQPQASMRPGRPRRKPQSVFADRGFDHDTPGPAGRPHPVRRLPVALLHCVGQL